MSRGLGRVEQVILRELLLRGALSINALSIAVADGKGLIIHLDSQHPAWQSTARAVRSLIKKGLIHRVSRLKKVYLSV